MKILTDLFHSQLIMTRHGFLVFLLKQIMHINQNLMKTLMIALIHLIHGSQSVFHISLILMILFKSFMDLLEEDWIVQTVCVDTFKHLRMESELIILQISTKLK